MTVDSNINLCLACSSSLPPRSHEAIFTTQCCQKPICFSCLTANPRLARYNPCLACLGGVQAISKGKQQQQIVPPDKVNIDGAVRDEDTFVLGDDDSDEEGLDGLNKESAAPPPYLEQTQTPEPSVPAPNEYYIQRDDSLTSIALRFGVSGRELCQLNHLPPSTMNITPHLLHTRTVLILPPSARLTDKEGNSLLGASSAENRLRAVRRDRERAEKRLQTITKEVDWRVAKAYVALAEDEDEEFRTYHDLKQKEMKPNISGGQGSNLELMALDRYLEDEEWEARERREGRSVNIQGFPLTAGKEEQKSFGKWFSRK